MSCFKHIINLRHKESEILLNKQHFTTVCLPAYKTPNSTTLTGKITSLLKTEKLLPLSPVFFFTSSAI